MNLGLIKISAEKNVETFAKIDWMLYKIFKKKRIYPCGRTKKDKYLCCCLYPNDDNSLIVEDGHRIICKVCGSTHVLSSSKINSIAEAMEF